jgi:hypothetical protein
MKLRPILACSITALLLLGCGSSDDAASAPKNEKMENQDVWAPLKRYIGERKAEFDAIPQDRKTELDALAEFVKTAKDTGVARLNFICTHNSRRSHFGQVWAQVAAHHFGGDTNVETYSGGTESTAFNERSVAAMRRAGLDVHPVSFSENPKYAVRYAEDRDPMVCFSKKYIDASTNPTSGFAAVMTCDEADKGCPVVFGAAVRFSTPYVDPKVSDGTPTEVDTYDERCAQIAREMLYVMSQAGA